MICFSFICVLFIFVLFCFGFVLYFLGDDGLSETSVLFIVVILALAFMCISCVCVFAWLVYKGKVNIQIGQPRAVSERLLLADDLNNNNVQLTVKFCFDCVVNVLVEK